MGKTYKHIFFDLDHTLWDFTSNSRKTLAVLFTEFGLERLGIPDFDTFMSHYEKVNEALWVKYRAGQIDKPTLRNGRFPKAFEKWGIVNDRLSREINERYLQDGPRQSGLMPNSIEVLEYLTRRYGIHLITNGFKEVQATKLRSSGLEGRFETITTSEEVGVLKPNIRVFEHAMRLANSLPEQSVYVGDHYETDVVGSRNAGIDQVFFNPNEHESPGDATFEIRDLAELRNFL